MVAPAERRLEAATGQEDREALEAEVAQRHPAYVAALEEAEGHNEPPPAGGEEPLPA